MRRCVLWLSLIVALSLLGAVTTGATGSVCDRRRWYFDTRDLQCDVDIRLEGAVELSERELLKLAAQALDDGMIVLFYGEECPLSAELRESFAQVASRFDSVYTATFNVRNGFRIFLRYGIRGYPLVAGFRDGDVQARYKGGPSLVDLSAWMSRFSGVEPNDWNDGFVGSDAVEEPNELPRDYALWFSTVFVATASVGTLVAKAVQLDVLGIFDLA